MNSDQYGPRKMLRSMEYGQVKANVSGEDFGHPWKHLSHQSLEESCVLRKRNRREVFPTSLFGEM